MAEIAGQIQSTQLTEMSLLDRCKAIEEAGMSVTQSWIQLWNESLSYFLSEQLKGYKRHKNWEWVVINYIWPSIMAELSKLSRNFKFVCSPTEPSDMEVSDAFQGFLQWQWDKGLKRGGMRVEQLKAILCGKLYGYRISKIYWDGKAFWDPKQRRWLGEIRHRLWHPAFFWASDKEYIEDGDCGTVRYLELEYAQSLWPEHKKDLKEQSVSYPDMLRAIGDEAIHGQTSTQGTYPAKGTGDVDKGIADKLGSTLLSLVVSEGRARATQIDLRRYCRISEQYLKDYQEQERREDVPTEAQTLIQTGAIRLDNGTGGYVSREGWPVTSDNWPSDEIRWKEPVFPNGRYIIRNEDVILNSEPEAQVYPHSQWSFIVSPHYLLPFMWQGSDAISLYRDTQDKINVTVSHLYNNAKEFGDPRMGIEEGALLVDPRNTKKRYEIIKGAGAVIRFVRGGLDKFKIFPPAIPSAAHVMIYQMMVQEYKNIQGMQDIALGRKTTGQTTATEAQHLAISANDRIKLQNIFEEVWAKNVISLVAEMDQYYYDTGRIVRIIGEDMMIGAVQITQRAKEAKFDIDIEPTEGLPWDQDKKIIKYEKAYMLLKDPAPNPLLPDMLRVLEISAWQKILRKHSQWQKWVQFEQLIMSVSQGKMAPQDAIRMLIAGAQQMIMAMQPAGEPNNGDRIGNEEPT